MASRTMFSLCFIHTISLTCWRACMKGGVTMPHMPAGRIAAVIAQLVTLHNSIARAKPCCAACCGLCSMLKSELSVTLYA